MVFIVPGFIALSVRSQFVAGRDPSDNKTALLSYLTVSVIYGAFTLIFVDPTAIHDSLGAWVGFVFVGPIFVGLLLGINIQRGFVRRLLHKLHLYPIHAIPAAWDWKFHGVAEQWVLVTLKDGTRFAGFYGTQSFTSSTPGERDLYIQWVYDMDEGGVWSRNDPEKSVLIAAGEIRTIEFWPYTPQEESDGQG